MKYRTDLRFVFCLGLLVAACNSGSDSGPESAVETNVGRGDCDSGECDGGAGVDGGDNVSCDTDADCQATEKCNRAGICSPKNASD